MFLNAFKKTAADPSVSSLPVNAKGPLGMTGPAPKMPAPPKAASMPMGAPQAAQPWNPSMKQFPRKAPAESQASVNKTSDWEMGIR